MKKKVVQIKKKLDVLSEKIESGDFNQKEKHEINKKINDILKKIKGKI